MSTAASTTSAPADGQVATRRLANAIRALSMDAVQAANSGHPGMPMGMADVATVLFGQFLKFDPTDPAWPDRDRFVLSAGHGSMLLYSLLYLTGYSSISHRRHRQVPPAGQPLRRTSGIWPCGGNRDHHWPTGPGDRHRGRHGAG